MVLFKRLLTLTLLLCVSACSGKPVAIDYKPEAAPVRGNTVYVDNHGWHTGFIIPADKIDADLPFLRDRFADHPPYYEFGWGDKGFYQAQKVTIGLTLRAMFWSDGSVMHVVAVPTTPFEYFEGSQVLPVMLSDGEFDNLRRFISGSFARDAQGNVIALQQGLYGDSQFYEGAGTYYILNTCNKWTAKGLKSSGLDISTPFKLTAGSVIGYLESLKDLGYAPREAPSFTHAATSFRK